MTLRRFVRVTLDNFRQLLQTISAPVTSLPMPQIVPPPSEHPASRFDQQPGSRPAKDGGAPINSGFGGDTLGGEQVGDEQVGDTGFGDETLGEQTLGDDLAEADTVGTPDGEDIAQGAADDDVTKAADTADGQDAAEERPAEQSAASLPLAAALESLLFVCDEAVEPARLAQALGILPAEAEAYLLALDAAYRQDGRGLRLQVRSGRYQLITAPEAANLIESFLNLDTGTRLSAPALETLAVVAYRQPVTRAQIEAVVEEDCSGVLRSLIGRGLLEEVGRLDAPGRPVLYGVTDLFMHHFGLTALHELPPLEDAEIARIEEVGA